MSGSIAITEEIPRRRQDHHRNGPLRRFYARSVFIHRDRTSLRSKERHTSAQRMEKCPHRARRGVIKPAGSRIVRLPQHPRDKLFRLLFRTPGPRNDEGRLGYPGRPSRFYSVALGRLRVRLRVGNFNAATRDGHIKSMIEPASAQETPRRRHHW